jgi:transcription antitermination factor NusG
MSHANPVFSPAIAPGWPPEALVEPRWYACYTRARHEKRVEDLLRKRGFESFLPVLDRVSQWKDRKKLIAWPLFPSYVFGKFTLSDVHEVLVTPGVSTIVKANGVPTAIPEAEMANVRRFALALAETGLELDPRPFLEEGQPVVVREGPFQGIEGVVVERRGRKRVLIGLRAIGRGLEVDIDTRLLRVLPALS